jgi:hypothetical protein
MARKQLSEDYDGGDTPSSSPSTDVTRDNHPSYAPAHLMTTYVDRLRPKLRDLDLSSPEMKSWLESGRAEMVNILVAKKISKRIAEWVVAQTLDLAVYQQLEELRRANLRSGLVVARESLSTLNRNVDRLVQAILKLPAASRTKLNKIMAQQDWEHFDTETFSELILTIQAASSSLSPTCFAIELRSTIEQSASKVSKDTAVMEVGRTGPPAILELWDMLPSKTRVQLEEHIRNSPPPTSALRFFQELASALARCRVNFGQSHPVEFAFAERVARLWAKLDLNIGRAYDFNELRHVESYFQKFCRIALTVIGDHSRISDRQISHLKVKFAAKTPAAVS